MDDCGKPYYAKGLCRRHYRLWLRYGDPHVFRDGVNRIGHKRPYAPTKPFGVTVNAEPYLRMTNWNRHHKYFHRWVMEQHLQCALTSDEIVHHRDSNPRNNDLSNLELMSRAEHCRLHRMHCRRKDRDPITGKSLRILC